MRASGTGRFATVAILAALASGASAEDRRVGAWSVGVMKGDSGTFAATENDAGGLLGQYCYPEQGTCVWILASKIVCETGNRYPLLVNTDAGAAVLEILCLDVEGKQRYAFTDFDAIDGIVHKARKLGMAFPTANGLFHVTRFSLDGASRAVALMRGVAESMGGKPETAPVGVTF
jgi:hypothetical protein